MRQALELALEALEEAWYHVGTFQPTEKAIDLYDEARAAIKEALAQPEQWGASAVTHPEYVAEQKRKTEELRSMLTQPEQEPVAHFGSAYINENGVHITTVLGPVAIPQDAKLYTTPLQQCYCGDITRLGVVHRADSFCDEKPDQEPVATLDDLEQEIYENTRQFVSRDVMEWMLKRYYTTPPQRKPLTDEQIAEMWLEILGSTPPSGIHEDGLQPWRFARAIEAAHGIKE